MQYNKGTIKHLQKFVTQQIEMRGFDDETLEQRLLLLTEELGELIHDCRGRMGISVDHNRKFDNDPGEQIVDILNMIFAVSAKLGIDVEKEFLLKEEKLERRNYKKVSLKK